MEFPFGNTVGQQCLPIASSKGIYWQNMVIGYETSCNAPSPPLNLQSPFPPHLANCTKAKIKTIFKPLILKGFICLSVLAQSLHSLLQRLPMQYQGADMNFIQEKFTSLFSEYEVTAQPRPDGAVLLTLRDHEGKQIRRSISYAQLNTPEQLSWVISAIRRDLAAEASQLPAINMLQSQNRFALPTYHSA
jgi:hypothetical protein